MSNVHTDGITKDTKTEKLNFTKNKAAYVNFMFWVKNILEKKLNFVRKKVIKKRFKFSISAFS